MTDAVGDRQRSTPTAPFVDLHAHSTASDGSRAPADVVRAAHARRPRGDRAHRSRYGRGHRRGDATGARARRTRRARDRAQCRRGRRGDAHAGAASRRYARARGEPRRAAGDATDSRAEHIVQRLNELGVRIEFGAVLEQAAGGAIGRPHVARALIAEGWAVDFRDAFDRYLGSGRPAYVAEAPSGGRGRDLAHPSCRRPGDSRASRAARHARTSRGVRPRGDSTASRSGIRAIRAKTSRAWRHWSSIFRWCRAAVPTGTVRSTGRGRSA